MLLSSRRAGTPRCGALVVPLLCCDGRDTIQGRWAGSVKDLRPRFTHTDIRAGQRHLGDLGASLRCRHWERSQASAAPSSIRTLRPGPTAWWSLVIDSTCQVCATQPRPVIPATPARRFPDRRQCWGDIPRGQVRVLPGGGIRRRRGQQTRPPTRNTSPAGRKCPRARRMSPHASELSETRRTLVVSNTARLPLSRGHRCPRMAADTTTADTTFVRAALRTIVTIGDS